MIFTRRQSIFLLFVLATAFAAEISTPETPKADDIQPIPTSTVDPITSTTANLTTTSEPVTTPAPVTTTTKPPTPPTSVTTSTPKPTKPPTPPTTSTTTSTTSSTTTASTTTSPTPTPKPVAENWIVKGPNGTVCITANMVVKVNVPYKNVENKTVQSSFMVEHVANATANGTCSGANHTESLVLAWKNVTATFHFALNESTKLYSLNSVSVTILVNNDTFPNNTMANVTEVKLAYKGELFSIPLNNSYICTTVAPLSLTGPNNTISGKLTVAKVHVQAFGTERTGKYRSPMDCASRETPDIVPIAVGLVLAGLVVIVLVAYLVGRRRAQARGYLSM